LKIQSKVYNVAFTPYLSRFAGSVCKGPILWDHESSQPKGETPTMQEASGCIAGEGAGGGPERNMGRPPDTDDRNRSQGLSPLRKGEDDPGGNPRSLFRKPGRQDATVRWAPSLRGSLFVRASVN